MKKILIFIVIILGTSIISVSPAFALKRAIFPDSQLLQPLPKDAYPNVSGNVNSTTNPPLEIQMENANQAPDSVAPPAGIPLENNSSFSIWWILFPLIAAVFIFTYIKLKKRQ